MEKSLQKSSKVWNKLFSPPCPKCDSTKTKEELRIVPVMGTMKELIEIKTKQEKGEAVTPTRTWKCQDCGTTFDEKGRFIAVER